MSKRINLITKFLLVVVLSICQYYLSEMRSSYGWVQISLDTIAHLFHWPRKIMMQAIVYSNITLVFTHISSALQFSVKASFPLCFLIWIKINWQSCWRTEKHCQLLLNFLSVVSDLYGLQKPKSFQKSLFYLGLLICLFTLSGLVL